MENTALIPSYFNAITRYSTCQTYSLSKLMTSTQTNPIYAMDIIQHPLEDSIFVCATTDHRIGVLDLNKGICVNQYSGHADRINELCFTGINEDKDLAHVFFSCSEDGFIMVWDTRTSTMVTRTSILINFIKISHGKAFALCCL